RQHLRSTHGDGDFPCALWHTCEQLFNRPGDAYDPVDTHVKGGIPRTHLVCAEQKCPCADGPRDRRSRAELDLKPPALEQGDLFRRVRVVLLASDGYRVAR